MDSEEIDKLIEAYDLAAVKYIKQFAEEIERTTRHRYFDTIQKANAAASAKSFTPRQLDRFTWECEHPPKKEKTPKCPEN